MGLLGQPATKRPGAARGAPPEQESAGRAAKVKQQKQGRVTLARRLTLWARRPLQRMRAKGPVPKPLDALRVLAAPAAEPKQPARSPAKEAKSPAARRGATASPSAAQASPSSRQAGPASQGKGSGGNAKSALERYHACREQQAVRSPGTGAAAKVDQLLARLQAPAPAPAPKIKAARWKALHVAPVKRLSDGRRLSALRPPAVQGPAPPGIRVRGKSRISRVALRAAAMVASQPRVAAQGSVATARAPEPAAQDVIVIDPPEVLEQPCGQNNSSSGQIRYAEAFALKQRLEEMRHNAEAKAAAKRACRSFSPPEFERQPPAKPAISIVAPPVLRQLPKLHDKLDDDNYELSDREGSDSEIAAFDRSSKHVPAWSLEYKQLVLQQASWDPDLIFGTRINECDLESIFPDSVYQEVEEERPQLKHRSRRSSFFSGSDALRPEEVQSYSQKMGHRQPPQLHLQRLHGGT